MIGLIDFETFERSRKPNAFVLAPEGFALQARPDEVSPQFEIDANILYQRVLQMVAGRGNWRLEECDDDSRQVHFVAVTSLLRFKDDVDIKAVPVEGVENASALLIYSRSRVGYSDLGANASRVLAILHALGAEE